MTGDTAAPTSSCLTLILLHLQTEMRRMVPVLASRDRGSATSVFQASPGVANLPKYNDRPTDLTQLPDPDLSYRIIQPIIQEAWTEASTSARTHSTFRIHTALFKSLWIWSSFLWYGVSNGERLFLRLFGKVHRIFFWKVALLWTLFFLLIPVFDKSRIPSWSWNWSFLGKFRSLYIT